MPVPLKKLSRAEKIHQRRLKRKQGPSAQRRKERREQLQPKPEVTPAETPTPAGEAA